MSTNTATTQRRNTHQRQLVLDAVRARCDHPTANAIYESVRARDKKISQATVYRNLHLLVEQGQIRSVPTPDGEHFDLRCDDHAHMVCRSCGAVADAAIPYQAKLDKEAAKATGWSVCAHETLFDGLCPDCFGSSSSSA